LRKKKFKLKNNKKITSLAPGIVLYENIFDAKKFIEELEKECNSPDGSTYWDASLVGSGNYSEYRSSLSCDISLIVDPMKTHRLYPLFKDSIYLKIDECVKDYGLEYNINSFIHEPLSVLKYSNGGQYRAHSDAVPNGISRVFSLVACLDNTSTGGQLEFPYFDLNIYLNPGSVVLFPSNYPYLHIARPVVDGIKYSLVTWYS
jgi:hypothetical protein